MKIQGNARSLGVLGSSIYTTEEWMVDVDDDLGDPDFPYFTVSITVGRRWGEHTSIDWSFDNIEEYSDDEIRDTLDSFANFVQAVNGSYKDYVEAVQSVLKKRNQDNQDS